MKKKVLAISLPLILLGVLVLLNYYSYYSREKNTYINPQRIKYITQHGGLPGTDWVIINYDSDYEKIEKVIGVINSCTNRYKAGREDLEFLKFRRGYPSSIYIKLKNGDEINVEKVYNIEIFENGHNATIDNKRILLTFATSFRTSYYIIESEDLVDYITEDVYHDIPRVENR